MLTDRALAWHDLCQDMEWIALVRFLKAARDAAPIQLYGDGRQTRSFCYVDDLIEAFTRFMAQKETVGPMNLGNPGEFTMLQLAELTLAAGDDLRQRLAPIGGGHDVKALVHQGTSQHLEQFHVVIHHQYGRHRPFPSEEPRFLPETGFLVL